MTFYTAKGGILQFNPKQPLDRMLLNPTSILVISAVLLSSIATVPYTVPWHDTPYLQNMEQ